MGRISLTAHPWLPGSVDGSPLERSIEDALEQGQIKKEVTPRGAY